MRNKIQIWLFLQSPYCHGFMERLFIFVALITFMPPLAMAKSRPVIKVDNETSLRAAIEMANHDVRTSKIIFKKNAYIELNAPIVYYGKQELIIFGNNAVIDGHNAGSFIAAEDMTAVSQDASLIFNTASHIEIHRLSVINSATRGIAVNIPADAKGQDMQMTLDQVNISNSALYGLHIDDNADMFDDSLVGSDIGIRLNISHSSFTGNGVGAIDFDGVRIDERGPGGIRVVITDTHIDRNGGDGIELDEAGPGDIVANVRRSTMNENGFFNAQDLDDGFDIDEADAGNVDVTLLDVEVTSNKEEGLDFDESGEGNIPVRMTNVTVDDNGDDGIQLTESGEGVINACLKKVGATNNAKYGIKLEQWMEKDEDNLIEEQGRLKIKHLLLEGNEKGDEIKTYNVNVIQSPGKPCIPWAPALANSN